MVEHRTETGCIFFVQPFHRHGSPQTPTVRRLRAFSMPKSPEWTRSIDTGFPWQNPPNAPIFVNIPTAAVRYIIKKASANFGKRAVLYRVSRMSDWRRKEMHLFCSTLLCVKLLIFLTVGDECDRIKKWLVRQSIGRSKK